MDGMAALGFTFGLVALAKVLLLEKQLKAKGVLDQADKKSNSCFNSHSARGRLALERNIQ